MKFLLIIFILTYLVIAISSNILILKSQPNLNKQYDETLDMKNCPQTARYFMNFQSKFQTWSLGTVTMGYSGFVIIIFLLLLKYIAMPTNHNVHPAFIGNGCLSIPMILLISFVCSLIVFICVYKTQNCLLARLCRMGSCGENFFKEVEST